MSAFTSTKHTNLVRHKSGFYHMRVKVGGRRIRVSLKTKLLTVAIHRRDAEVARRRTAARVFGRAEGWTMEEAIYAYRAKIAAKPIKPRSKVYREETVTAIEETAAEMLPKRMDEIRLPELEAWIARVDERYSAGRHNGMVESMRGIFAGAVEAGATLDNPAMKLHRRRVPSSNPDMPEKDNWAEALKIMEVNPKRRQAWYLVRLLESTGLRISEAQALVKEDVDLARNTLTVQKSKNSERRVIPLTPQAKVVLEELVAHAEPGQSLAPIQHPKGSLAESCKEAGCPHMTPHKIRHLFATRCIESGVDIRTVAEWLGHKDRGVTLLRRYAHLRNDHHQKMALLVG